MFPRLPSLEPVDLDSDSPAAKYLRATAAVCPFIEPSAKAGFLSICEITPDCKSGNDIHPRLFEQLVPQIERFRDVRRKLPEKLHQLLVCHTILVRFPPHLDAEAVRQLRWPNLLGWTLKYLYTPKEIVLGFVRKGVAENASFGAPIPVAPFHAILIRSRVVATDRRFYPGNEAMLKSMLDAYDDGADVHSAILEDVPDIRDPQALRDGNHYNRLCQWWQKKLARQ